MRTSEDQEILDVYHLELNRARRGEALLLPGQSAHDYATRRALDASRDLDWTTVDFMEWAWENLSA